MPIVALYIIAFGGFVFGISILSALTVSLLMWIGVIPFGGPPTFLWILLLGGFWFIVAGVLIAGMIFVIQNL